MKFSLDKEDMIGESYVTLPLLYSDHGDELRVGQSHIEQKTDFRSFECLMRYFELCAEDEK